MATPMELSLDDIITQTKVSGRGGGRGRGRGRGGSGMTRNRGFGTRSPRGGQRGRGNLFRSRNSNADGVWTHDKFQDAGFGTRPGLRSIGGGGGTGPAKITISNLHFGVSDADILELFGELGRIKYASVHYDRTGRSMGKADVTFERRAEAQMAIQQYNGVPLDGRTMQITWASAAEANASSTPRGGGLRQVQGGRVGRSSPVGGRGKLRGQSQRGGGRGRGFGGNRGGRGKGTTPKTAAELDAELDAYIKQNQK